ncbi:hypothetical protein EDD86DRAFT_138369 [Gorgonomyces haynaldii]|nr:hypothetical protein EDD86DRAFT_138369 [Gorgonomyces haynaldii]
MDPVSLPLVYNQHLEPQTTNYRPQLRWHFCKNDRFQRWCFQITSHSSPIRIQDNLSYFESEFDDGSQWGAAHVTQVCALANSVAQGVYKLAAGTDAPPTVSVDCQFVDQLMGCLTRNMTCQIYQGLVPNITFGSTKLSSYAFLSSIGIYEDFVGRLSANLTGTLTQKQCKYDSECPVFQVTIDVLYQPTMCVIHDQIP